MSYHTRSRASVPARHHGKACACDHITDFIAMHCSALRLDPPSTHDRPMYIAARAHALAEIPFLSLFTPILHSPRGVWAECCLIGVCMAMHDVAGLYRAEIDKRATKPLHSNKPNQTKKRTTDRKGMYDVCFGAQNHHHMDDISQSSRDQASCSQRDTGELPLLHCSLVCCTALLLW
jgi:hypothetical protein